MDYITAKEAAQKWDVSERRVQLLCAQDRIVGVQRLGKAWAILVLPRIMYTRKELEKW